jgi:acyl-[acyl-carrier-protein]-phospholipid O-acyltransferase/long-chain-fatty-acid--[acyl-carrier-protein] ligase
VNGLPSSTGDAASAGDVLPPLGRDPSFWGLTATQFLGAFNDNLYKQLVLLICLDYVALRQLDSDPYQSIAQGMFSLPFVLLSGFAGWLSDRYSKRSIVVWSKVGEIIVMGAGLAVFALCDFGTDAYLIGLMAVLFLMGAQSAFFGPAKYGILPEMLRDGDLPLANGLVQMTTFLAIIFGTALCGLLKQELGGTAATLWQVSAACVLVAVIGTLTSLVIRRTPVAAPGLPFRVAALVMDSETFVLLKFDRQLRGVLLAMVLFWFLGGVCLPAVNALGKEQFGLDDRTTSLMTASIGFGIAIGCVVAGLSSKHRVRFGLVRLGAWGMTMSFTGLALLPRLSLPASQLGYAAAACLALIGLSAGIYAVPLQTFLQSRPPADQKGRMIAAMNVCTWLGIFASAGFYGLCSMLFTPRQISYTFYVLAAIILPLAIGYRPRDQELTRVRETA